MHPDAERLLAAVADGGAPVPESAALLEALDVYVTSLAAVDLAPARRAALCDVVARVLRVRGWAESAPPADGEVPAPVVVLGMPRSGSTFLHLLLAAAPELVPLTEWEAASPVPSAPELVHVRDRMRRDAVAAVHDLEAHELTDWHLEGARQPTEDTTLLVQGLRCWSIAAGMPMPAYDEWLAAAGLADAYDWHRAALAHLPLPPGRDRVLHAPEHSLAVDELLRVHPDAHLVLTWRDPTAAMASLMDFAETERRFLGAREAPADLAATWVPRWADGLRDVVAHRDRLAAAHAGRVVDVDYTDLAADPVGTASAVLEHLGLDPERAAPTLAAVVAAHPHGDGGHHAYDPSLLGPVRHDIDRLFDGVGPAHPPAG